MTTNDLTKQELRFLLQVPDFVDGTPITCGDVARMFYNEGITRALDLGEALRTLKSLEDKGLVARVFLRNGDMTVIHTRAGRQGHSPTAGRVWQ